MARFVCLLLACFVTCSQAGDGTLAENCEEVCKILGNFIKEDSSVDPMIPEWLESNGLMEGEWDWPHMRKIAVKVGEEVVKCKEENNVEEMQKISKKVNDALESMAVALVDTIEKNISEECKQKYEHIMSQIM